MTSIERIRAEYPLHWCVWNDDHKELQDLLKANGVCFFFLLWNFVAYKFVIAHLFCGILRYNFRWIYPCCFRTVAKSLSALISVQFTIYGQAKIMCTYNL